MRIEVVPVMTASPSTRYLADLVRAWSRGQHGPVPPPAGHDRDGFLRLFAGHAAAPALASLLDPDAVPAGDWERLHRAIALARQRTAWLLLEMERILPALTEAGCRPIALKGAPLAAGLYPRAADRWFIDLDLLLTREELPAAYDALERVGYRFAETPRSVRYYEEHHFHRILRGGQGAYLEVHWAITLPRSVYTYDLDALRRDARPVPLGRATMLAPSSTDQILHGVLQSIAGGFNDLRRILDLHLLDARLDDAARARLAERARSCQLLTGLWLQYDLRAHLTGAAIPPAIDAACRPTPRVQRLLANLDVTEGCLTQRTRQAEGYDYLVHLLCSPAGRRAREMRRFLVPDVAGLLETGLQPADLHNPLRRARLTLRRAQVAARMLGYATRASLAPVSWR